MQEKHEWRKKEKTIYLPKAKPETIDIPNFNFLTIRGKGNPNSLEFSECVEVLYALAYGIKMQLKRRTPQLSNYIDFTVYPLEGIWDITDEAKEGFNGELNKDDLTYHLMIRQPEFVSDCLFAEIREVVKQKKKLPLIDFVKFETISEGLCVQMMHLGSFDHEPESFAQMEAFAQQNGLERLSKVHREIYLSDPRKVSPEKYKTVLRFQAQRKTAA